MATTSGQHTTKVNDEFSFELVSYKNPRMDLVTSFYHDVASKNFTKDTLEDLDLWLGRLESPESDVSFLWSMQVVIQRVEKEGVATEVVVGGAAIELYVHCHCGLLPYVVLSDAVRGKGIASKLVRTCFASLQAQCVELGHAHLDALFIEVVHSTDSADDISGLTPRDRQVMWQRMHFLPIGNVDLVHPGRLKGHHHNLCLYVPPAHHGGPPSRTVIPSKVILAFIKDLFAGILADENIFTTEEYNAFAVKYASVVELPVGEQYWV